MSSCAAFVSKGELRKGFFFCLQTYFEIAPPKSKGNQVNIPEPGCGYWGRGHTLLQPFFFTRKGKGEGVNCGNANEFGDAGGSPGKSYLFFLT